MKIALKTSSHNDTEYTEHPEQGDSKGVLWFGGRTSDPDGKPRVRFLHEAPYCVLELDP